MKSHRIVALFAATLAVLALIGLPVARVYAGATYYSQGSLAPNQLSSWSTLNEGGGSAPANFTSGDVFVIQNGHSMTTSAAWSLSGTGSKLWIENGGALIATSAVTLATATTFQIDAGGTYVHNNSTAYGSTIFQGTEAFAAASTVILNNSSSTGPSSVAFGNLTVNFTSDPGAAVNCGGGVTTINGNLTIQSTSTREFRLTAGTNFTLNLGGILDISGGALNLASGTAAPAISIGGDVSISAGVLDLGTGSGAPALTINGNFDQSGGTLQRGGSNNRTIKVGGNWTRTGGTFNNAGITVVMDGTNQALRTGAAGAVATETFCNLTIAAGATLDTGEDLVAVGSGGSCGTLTQDGVLRRTSLGQEVTRGGGAITFLDARGAPAAILTQPAGGAGNNLGSATVAVVSNALPGACNGTTFGPNSKPLKRWYEIRPANSGIAAAAVRLYFRTASPDERNGANAAAVEIFHCESSGWKKLPGAYARGSDAGSSYVELPNVTTFSRFALAEPSPAAVTLEGFQAVADPAAGAIDLTWQTAQETANLGFNLWRGASPAGPDVRLNDAIIPSQAPGGALGASYVYTDTHALRPGATYFYWLEDVALDGAPTRHEPVGVAYPGPTAVRLNSLRAGPASGLEVTNYVVMTVVALALLAAADVVRATVRRRR